MPHSKPKPDNWPAWANEAIPEAFKAMHTKDPRKAKLGVQMFIRIQMAELIGKLVANDAFNIPNILYDMDRSAIDAWRTSATEVPFHTQTWKDPILHGATVFWAGAEHAFELVADDYNDPPQIDVSESVKVVEKSSKSVIKKEVKGKKEKIPEAKRLRAKYDKKVEAKRQAEAREAAVLSSSTPPSSTPAAATGDQNNATSEQADAQESDADDAASTKASKKAAWDKTRKQRRAEKRAVAAENARHVAARIQVLDPKPRVVSRNEKDFLESKTILEKLATRDLLDSTTTTQLDFWIHAIQDVFPWLVREESAARLLALRDIEIPFPHVPHDPWAGVWHSFTYLRDVLRCRMDPVKWGPILTAASEGWKEFQGHDEMTFIIDKMKAVYVFALPTQLPVAASASNVAKLKTNSLAYSTSVLQQPLLPSSGKGTFNFTFKDVPKPPSFFNATPKGPLAFRTGETTMPPTAPVFGTDITPTPASPLRFGTGKTPASFSFSPKASASSRPKRYGPRSKSQVTMPAKSSFGPVSPTAFSFDAAVAAVRMAQAAAKSFPSRGDVSAPDEKAAEKPIERVEEVAAVEEAPVEEPPVEDIAVQEPPVEDAPVEVETSATSQEDTPEPAIDAEQMPSSCPSEEDVCDNNDAASHGTRATTPEEDVEVTVIAPATAPIQPVPAPSTELFEYVSTTNSSSHVVKDTTVTVPEVKKDDTIVLSEEKTSVLSKEEVDALVKEWNATNPEPTTELLEYSHTTDSSKVVVENSSVAAVDDATVIVVENDEVAVPEDDGITVHEDDETTVPEDNGVTLSQNDETTAPQDDEATVPKDDVVELPEEATTVVPEDIEITVPDDNTVAAPNDDAITNPEENPVTIVDNTVTVSVHEDTTITVSEDKEDIAITVSDHESLVSDEEENVTPGGEDSINLAGEDSVAPVEEESIDLAEDDSIAPAKEEMTNPVQEENVTPVDKDDVTSVEEEGISPAEEEIATAVQEENITLVDEDNITTAEEESIASPEEDSIAPAKEDTAPSLNPSSKTIPNPPTQSSTLSPDKLFLSISLAPLEDLESWATTTFDARFGREFIYFEPDTTALRDLFEPGFLSPSIDDAPGETAGSSSGDLFGGTSLLEMWGNTSLAEIMTQEMAWAEKGPVGVETGKVLDRKIGGLGVGKTVSIADQAGRTDKLGKTGGRASTGTNSAISNHQPLSSTVPTVRLPPLPPFATLSGTASSSSAAPPSYSTTTSPTSPSTTST